MVTDFEPQDLASDLDRATVQRDIASVIYTNATRDAGGNLVPALWSRQVGLQWQSPTGLALDMSGATPITVDFVAKPDPDHFEVGHNGYCDVAALGCPIAEFKKRDRLVIVLPEYPAGQAYRVETVDARYWAGALTFTRLLLVVENPVEGGG